MKKNSVAEQKRKIKTKKVPGKVSREKKQKKIKNAWGHKNPRKSDNWGQLGQATGWKTGKKTSGTKPIKTSQASPKAEQTSWTVPEGTVTEGQTGKTG